MGRYLWLVVLLVFLVACQNAPAAPILTPTSAAPTSTPTPSPSPTPAPTATPTATPAPPTPTLSVSDQILTQSGQLTIEQITALAPGWITVYTDAAGEPDEILGFARVETGENQDLEVEIDPYKATPRLHVVLHTDAGDDEVFEFPGTDVPVEVEGEPVTAGFDVTLDFPTPGLQIADQEVTPAGEIVVAQAIAPGPAWLVIHADAGGEPGIILGQTPLEAGTNEDIRVQFDWRQATRTLYAVMHHDAGEPGLFEAPAPDSPVLSAGAPVALGFTVDLPPDVFVISQPVVNDQVVIERAVINQPGWLAVYNDLDGVVNLRLGMVELEPGVNTGLVVPIEGSPVTDVLHVMLHADNEPFGEFRYPGPDDPLRYDGRLQVFTFRTDTGNYVITRDQALGEDNSIQVPLVVSDVPVWVVVRAEEAGEPGEIIGRVWTPAGVNRGVVVPLESEPPGETLYILLVQDTNSNEQFDYPDGIDVPLQRNRNLIQAPFNILEPSVEPETGE